MSLNDGQKAAVEAVFRFLHSEDKEFILSGPAGTGKTFLMKHIMEHVLKEYADSCRILGLTPVRYELALTATTNKATEVLQLATGFPAKTIHSFMNLKVRDNYKTGVTEITPTGAWNVHHRKLIFIDEASMIDSALHSYIHKGTDRSCKIIYIGDHCQLAPVFEKISPVYEQPKHFVVLTEPVRNAGQPALMALCDQLRETVETLVFHPIQEIPGIIDHLDDAGAKAFIDTTFATENPSSRILCYSNSRVKEYNEYVRSLRGYPRLLTQGETVINNSGISIGGELLRVEQEFLVDMMLDSPHEHRFDPKDPNGVLDIYRMRLIDPANQKVITVSLPVDPDHHQALMKHYARIEDWNTYYHLKNNFPDLRPKDSATVYKAQGSTYDSVFLDLGNIGSCSQADQVARMLYVGASRARTRLFLYGQLPRRYQSG